MMYIEEYNNSYEDIVIPEEVYLAICEELHCESIKFMGIS